MNLEKVGFLEQREQRKQLEGSCCLGGGVGGDADWTTDVATCVNSRITGANISQNSVVPVPSEKMKLRPFILLFSNLIYFA